jgi:hypothetical protein
VQTPLRIPEHILDYYQEQKEQAEVGSRNKIIAGVLAYFKEELEAMPEGQRLQVIESLSEYGETAD